MCHHCSFSRWCAVSILRLVCCVLVCFVSQLGCGEDAEQYMIQPHLCGDNMVPVRVDVRTSNPSIRVYVNGFCVHSGDRAKCLALQNGNWHRTIWNVPCVVGRNVISVEDCDASKSLELIAEVPPTRCGTLIVLLYEAFPPSDAEVARRYGCPVGDTGTTTALCVGTFAEDSGPI